MFVTKLKVLVAILINRKNPPPSLPSLPTPTYATPLMHVTPQCRIVVNLCWRVSPGNTR